METEVSSKFYICLDMVDGSILYFNNEHHLKHWSAFRREGTSWVFKNSALDVLDDQLNRNNVPPNARVIELKTIIQEVK